MIDIKSIAESVLKYSPAVATALGSPVAGMVLSLLATWFHVEPEKLAETMSTDPNTEFKIKQFELEHKESLAKIQSTNYSLEVDDRKNAREREVKFIEQTGKRDWVEALIALIVVSGFFIMCILVAITKQDNTDHDILYMLIGQLTSGFILILSYFFGSINKKN